MPVRAPGLSGFSSLCSRRQDPGRLDQAVATRSGEVQISSLHSEQKPCRRRLAEHADPDHTVLYVGIDWSEQRRVPAIERGWSPWTVRFPMCEPPYLSNNQMLDWAAAVGRKSPRLYEQGFTHNNCFGVCVRARQRQWLHLPQVAPARFEQADAEEEKLRQQLGDIAILRERRAGVSYPLPLRELRRRARQRGYIG